MNYLQRKSTMYPKRFIQGMTKLLYHFIIAALLAGLLASAIPPGVVQAKIPTGYLNTARDMHTATLLPDGRVLVAGGFNSTSDCLSSAEVYDPAMGAWTTTDDLNTARHSHTATLLPDGRVLVAGGRGPNIGPGGTNILSSAEVYDPATGTWNATGGLNTARRNHTATLLSDGRVLVLGGRDNFTDINSAEVYDPSTGTWSATTDIPFTVRNHTATLLSDGRVLLVIDDRAEVYDPSTGSWSTTGTLNTARWNHTATLLPDGRVLVVGGRGPHSGPLSSAELYDPATGTWSTTADMPRPFENHTATLLPDGQVLVVGGWNDAGAGLSDIKLYDPTTGTWRIDGLLTACREDHTATLLPSGQVLVVGGYNRSLEHQLDSAEVYDPGTDTWTSGWFSLNTARYSHTATLLPSGKVLVAGGWDGSYLSSAELYTATSIWSATGSLSTARTSHTATLLPDGRVLVAGGLGSGDTYLSSAEVYDPATGVWSATGSLNTGRYFHTATLLPDGRVLVAGGRNWSYLSSAEIYDRGTGVWSATDSLNTAREGHTATLLPNGKVLVAGGYNFSSGYLDSVEEYNPSTDTWSATDSLGTARRSHTATLLPDGRVLVAGGYYYDGSIHNPTRTEVYDPATGPAWFPGPWSDGGELNTARRYHTATLLPNDRVLVAGGYNGSLLASVEFYSRGLGSLLDWRPILSTVTSPLDLGSQLVADGSSFRGLSEASGGNDHQNSATNYPLVQLHRVDNDQMLWLPVDPNTGFSSDTSFTSVPVTNFLPGHTRVTMFVNGIPSVSEIILIQTADKPAPGLEVYLPLILRNSAP